MKSKVIEELKKVMNPEFLNRIDEIIVFHPLTKDDLRKIVDIMLEDLIKRLNEKKITIELTDNAKDLLIEKGYDPVYGARPLRRAIQKMLEDPLAEKILSGAILAGQKIITDRDSNELIFKVAR
jgi:ATP-dependent Clp protease ATP-binding subunit ClpC